MPVSLSLTVTETKQVPHIAIRDRPTDRVQFSTSWSTYNVTDDLTRSNALGRVLIIVPSHAVGWLIELRLSLFSEIDSECFAFVRHMNVIITTLFVASNGRVGLEFSSFLASTHSNDETINRISSTLELHSFERMDFATLRSQHGHELFGGCPTRNRKANSMELDEKPS